MIDGSIYRIPTDMTEIHRSSSNNGQDWLVIFAFTFQSTYNEPGGSQITINHWIEIFFDFDDITPSAEGLITICIYHYADYSKTYTMDFPYRIDLDIIGGPNDWQEEFTNGWNVVDNEKVITASLPWASNKYKAYQYDSNSYRDGSIQPWSQNDQIYFLRYHTNEYNGMPGNYLNSENLNEKDDLFWVTSANTYTGKGSPEIEVKAWLW